MKFLNCWLLLIFLFPVKVYAQDASAIKFADMSFVADIRVYFTNMSFSADESWYIAGKCSSLRAANVYVTGMSFAADLQVYLTSMEFSADRKICITNSDDAPSEFWEAYNQ